MTAFSQMLSKSLFLAITAADSLKLWRCCCICGSVAMKDEERGSHKSAFVSRSQLLRGKTAKPLRVRWQNNRHRKRFCLFFLSNAFLLNALCFSSTRWEWWRILPPANRPRQAAQQNFSCVCVCVCVWASSAWNIKAAWSRKKNSWQLKHL